MLPARLPCSSAIVFIILTFCFRSGDARRALWKGDLRLNPPVAVHVDKLAADVQAGMSFDSMVLGFIPPSHAAAGYRASIAPGPRSWISKAFKAAASEARSVL